MSIHIKDLLNDFLKEKQTHFKDLQNIENVVSGVLGSNWQEDIFIKEIKEKVILFKAKNSTVGYNFYLKKNILLKEIQKQLPTIEDLKILL